MRLTRVDNPPCPTCGCNSSTVISERDGRMRRINSDGSVTVTDYTIQTRRCDNDRCMRVWSQRATCPTEPAPIEPPAPPVAGNSPPKSVTFRVMKCPKCGTGKPRTTSTRLPIRYHKCRNRKCNHTFKSVE